MTLFKCPYLDGTLWPQFHPRIETVLGDPDEVQLEGTTHLLSKWSADVLRGKHIVVAVVTDALPPDAVPFLASFRPLAKAV
jgi:hypothetical protein